MKVPVYNQQVNNVTVNANPEAFGANIAQAAQQLGTSMENAGRLLNEHKIEKQQQLDLQQVLDTETEMRKEIDNLLYSNEVDKNNVPAGIMNRSLKNADGATVDFDSKMEQIRQKYAGTLRGENQQNQFNRLYKGVYDSTRGNVIQHEAKQLRDDNIKTTNDNLSQKIGDVAKNPNQLSDVIASGKAILQITGTRLGQGAESIALSQQDFAGKAAANAIKPLLDNGDYTSAKKIFDSIKNELPGDVAEGIEKAISDTAFTDEMAGVYTKLSPLKLPDGNPDYTKMEAEVNKLYDGEKQEKVWNYVKAKANEFEAIQNKEREAKDRQFTNDVNSFKYNGGGLDGALKFVRQYAYDSTDRMLKEKYVRELYATKDKDIKTNVGAYVALWEGIKDGNIKRDDVDQAYTTGLLSGTDWKGLRQDLYTSLNQEKTSEEKSKAAIINATIDRTISKFNLKNKDKTDFKYFMKLYLDGEGKDKTPEEIQIYAEKTAKPMGGFLGIGSSRPFEDLLKARDKKLNEWSAVFDKYGSQEIVGAIGLSNTKNGQYTRDDIAKFETDIGGLGQKQKNAIQSLYSNSKPITAKNVLWVMQNYKNGVIQ